MQTIPTSPRELEKNPDLILNLHSEWTALAKELRAMFSAELKKLPDDIGLLTSASSFNMGDRFSEITEPFIKLSAYHDIAPPHVLRDFLDNYKMFVSKDCVADMFFEIHHPEHAQDFRCWDVQRLCVQLWEAWGVIDAVIDTLAGTGGDTGPKPSPDFSSLTWNGKRYEFKKGQQAKAIEVLFDAYQQEQTLKADTIKKKIRSKTKDFRLKHVFRGNPAFDEIIKRTESGNYTLKPPEK